MATRPPRPSTDEETAPLLRDPEVEAQHNGEPQSFSDRITSVAQEPLTPLTKILLVLALVLLLLSSVFIGLFAGLQHKLSLERGRHDGGGGNDPIPAPPETVTVTNTKIATSTSVYTSTVAPAPIPVPTSPPAEKACLTSQCIILSASILSSLDTTQDPCENFYEFANNGWLKAHPLPADKGSFGNFEALAQENKQLLQTILESNTTGPTPEDAQLLRKLRGLYSSCLDENTLNDIGEDPLIDFVSTVRRLFRGKTTVVDGAEEDGGDQKTGSGLTAAVAFLHSRGVDALFDFTIDGDGLQPNLMSLWFSQPTLGLPSKEYYEEESITDVYKDVLERLLLTLDEGEEALSATSSAGIVDNEDNSNVWPPWPWPPWGGDGDDDDDEKKPVDKKKRAHKLAKKVVKFESKLAEASLDLDLLSNPLIAYNPRPFTNLTASLPQIHFGDYLSAFASRAFPEQVVITYPAYPVALAQILNETSADVVEAYLVARAALTLSPYLGLETEAWQAQRVLAEVLGGLKKGAIGDRGEYCVGQVESALGFAAGRYFVNETFGGDSRTKGTKVITDIVDAFKASLPHVPWMDKKSADAAAEKADAIRVKVGFPVSPDTLNPRSIAYYYSQVHIDPHRFFDNIVSAARSDEIKKWATLGRQRDLNSWEMYPSTVNAYFNPPANEIVFPAGILQPPFFSQDWPAYLSYGSFGHVAAHELTHAFDSSGRLYDQQGRLREWWTNATSDGFQVKQDCIVKQYSEYTIDDGKGGRVHVNGNLTSGENIGDTGLIQAYRAWKAQYASSLAAGDEYLLPGLDFTREQLFFISFARIWARSMKPAAAVLRIRTDPHSPNPYRVDGTVFNIPEFATAFNCSAKAKLNPPREKQCVFWG